MSALVEAENGAMEPTATDDDESLNLCTYVLSRNNMLHQAVYLCRTCSVANSNVCCCTGCSVVCHNGHDVDFLAFGNAYCDCGAAGCCLARDSEAAGTKLLGDRGEKAKEGISINHDAFASLQKPPFSEHRIEGLRAFPAVNAMLQRQCTTLVEHSKETFWFPMDGIAQPTCAFEALAKTVFEFHTRNAVHSFDPATSGAEFWVQVKKHDDVGTTAAAAAHSLSSSSFSSGTRKEAGTEEEERGSSVNNGVDLHYDKDEEIAAAFSVGLFPVVSTVTYLTSLPNTLPTVVLDATAAQEVGTAITRCFVSVPDIGKHISFDGRLLHGAPKELSMLSSSLIAPSTSSSSSSPSAAASAEGRPALRITFLVNVWLNHRPASVQRLPPHIVEQLNVSAALFSTNNSTTSGSSSRNSNNISNGVSETLRAVLGLSIEDVAFAPKHPNDLIMDSTFSASVGGKNQLKRKEVEPDSPGGGKAGGNGSVSVSGVMVAQLSVPTMLKFKVVAADAYRKDEVESVDGFDDDDDDNDDDREDGNENENEEECSSEDENNNNLYGNWVNVPFVSEKSEWGKSEDETGLGLEIFLPHSIRTLVALNLRAEARMSAAAAAAAAAAKKKGKSSGASGVMLKKGARKVAAAAAAASSMLRASDCDVTVTEEQIDDTLACIAAAAAAAAAAPSTTTVVGSSVGGGRRSTFSATSYVIEYCSDDCAARLVYEEEEDDDQLIGGELADGFMSSARV